MVAKDQDLTSVAQLISADDVAQVQLLLDSGSLSAVEDHQALKWCEADALVWSVVVKPFVLVQELSEQESH